jgi:hypothetical protein
MDRPADPAVPSVGQLAARTGASTQSAPLFRGAGGLLTPAREPNRYRADTAQAMGVVLHIRSMLAKTSGSSPR